MPEIAIPRPAQLRFNDIEPKEIAIIPRITDKMPRQHKTKDTIPQTIEAIEKPAFSFAFIVDVLLSESLLFIETGELFSSLYIVPPKIRIVFMRLFPNIVLINEVYLTLKI